MLIMLHRKVSTTKLTEILIEAGQSVPDNCFTFKYHLK